MKRRLYLLVLICIFLAGLSLFLYPRLSDSANTLRQARAISGYTEAVTVLEEDDYSRLWEAACEYNERLAKRPISLSLSESELFEYEQLLNVSGNGIMGCLSIPKINVSLPVYHGSNEEVLQTALGHLEGTSLPVGGTSSHCVLSGHRGLPSAKLFTNLDRLEVGDTFFLRVLRETLTYEVDQLLVVEPDELSALEIEEGEDLCTLVTCTPYGINTHRLLVRGHRIPNPSDEALAGTFVSTSQWLLWPLSIAAVILVIAGLFLAAALRKRAKNK